MTRTLLVGISIWISAAAMLVIVHKITPQPFGSAFCLTHADGSIECKCVNGPCVISGIDFGVNGVGIDARKVKP